jgi:hypothetical protein
MNAPLVPRNGIELDKKPTRAVTMLLFTEQQILFYPLLAGREK